MANRKGFTLAELIIGLAVVVILIGIALPRLRTLIDENNLAKAETELKALQAAVESYAAGPGKAYPETGSSWQSALTDASTKPRLIGIPLRDPFSGAGASYRYGKTADGKFYVIWSVGPDHQPDLTFNAVTGAVTAADDDLYVSNGNVGSGGF
ncbi:MAG: prepilin-type N-terminal cleavage/methylation domain-containing protein [Candidatus Omnitrophota bacterium]|nr:prepilin-type N-terminal cleavage/methylation domain-containing protein [Candidatus Omnitrophota bacterium]